MSPLRGWVDLEAVLNWNHQRLLATCRILASASFDADGSSEKQGQRGASPCHPHSELGHRRLRMMFSCYFSQYFAQYT